MPIKIGDDFEGDFDAAVAHVKRTKPDVSDPEAYVASIMHKQEIKEQISLFGKSFPDFDSAVDFVKKTRPDIANPEGYVSSIFRHTETESTKTYTPEEAGYVKSKTPRECGSCEYFTKPNKCQKIPTIAVDAEEDCCNLWNPFKKRPEDIINSGMKEAHTSTSYYGRNMNAELDEDSYLKQALAFLSAAVKAHNMEDQRPEMEEFEHNFLMNAKVMLDNAVRIHTKEAIKKIDEITTLDDIPTPTHGSSRSSSNIPWQGHNVDAHGIWMIVRAYIELKNRGIPDTEALRAIAMRFGTARISGINTQYEPYDKYAPENTHYWPLKTTGSMDNVDRIYPNLIPSSAFSPQLPPHIEPPRIESVAISGALSNVSIGAKKEDVLPSMNGITPLELPLPPFLDNTNYGATGNDMQSQSSMHGEQGWVPSKQIPEESFYDPMNKSFSKRASGIAPQTSKTSTQISLDGSSSYGPNDHMPGESEAVIPRDQILPVADNHVIEPGMTEQVGYPPIKLRQMGKFHYSNHGHTSKYQEHKGMHICEQLNNTVWDMSDVRRPILPMEGAGMTNTHPNCQCTWEYFTMVDPDPLAYASIVKPTFNGKPLEDFNWKGKAIDHISNINNVVDNKWKSGQLHQLNTDGSVGKIMECTCGCKKHKAIKMFKALRESLKDEFQWVTPEYMFKIKSMEKEVGPRFYFVRASAETITDHRSEGEPYRRKLDAEELWALARTGIGKGIDINHDSRYKTEGYVVDGDFDPVRKEVQFIVHESDPEIIRAIDSGIITAVSINGGSPRMEFVGPCEDGCEHDTEGCELCLHPRGVILGEQDNIAFTWVVTNPKGFTWKGIHMNAASPGVKVTKIEPL